MTTLISRETRMTLIDLREGGKAVREALGWAILMVAGREIKVLGHWHCYRHDHRNDNERNRR